MTATPEDLVRRKQAIQNAVNFAIVGLLHQPEYDMDYIEECIEDFQKDSPLVIDPDVVASKLDEALAELAKPFLAALPEQQRAAHVRQ